MQNQSVQEGHTLANLVASGVKLTPMMEQYYQVKKQYPDILLMFRMGDFYEMFFEDAREAARILNISLTVRGKLGEVPIPMAGIPHHAAATYVDRISQQGKKVVICEQLEDPKSVKGIVKRGVTQIVSPGMPYDLDKTTATENKFLAAGLKNGASFILVLLDFTTGDFYGVTFKTIEEFCERLLMVRPKEFISYMGQWENYPMVDDYLHSIDALKTHLSAEYFEEKHTGFYIQKLIPTYQRDGIIAQLPAVLSPLGALSYYVTSTQTLEKISHLRPFKIVNNEETMKVTYATLSGLEIFPRSRETEMNSLLGFMDKTKTSMGTRYLRQFFQSPLCEAAPIQKRLDLIEGLIKKPDFIKSLRTHLQDVRDIDRIMAKVSTKKVNAGDVLNLAHAFETFLAVEKEMDAAGFSFFQKLPKKDMEYLQKLAKDIRIFINDEMGAHADKGNLIRPGASAERDRLANLSNSAADEILKVEAKYRAETGIGNLKIKHNNISGYFIEVSNSHLSKVPKSFMRRQTLVNNERYVTAELEAFEKEVTSALDKLVRLEKEIFEGFSNRIEEQSHLILDVAKRMAQIDVFQSLAWISLQENFVRPVLHADRKIVKITGAWHPLIKRNIKDSFVTHNVTLDESCYFGLITGPNMAGKTTVMREVAIIQYLAQMGCFVPAHSVELGICDYLFSRLGASDDIIKGQSTFMVEMAETAEILRHATDRSLIILDEIGRGTSTYDGLSIAWALVEHFVKKLKPITLFATHYHELIELAETLPEAKNFTVRTEQKNGKVQFLYELIEEGATQSFGIHVAELAGLPRDVLKRSREILKELEQNHNSTPKEIVNSNQLTFFGAPSISPEVEVIPDYLSNLESDLKALDVMNLTPMQALQKLHDLKTQMLNH
ncbi:DNA mismatch repair protein MutS [Peredibacter sp. HCB2-198]|uniref:DNA mismatch repair protein MutS n=1 Tax=Peredibacter sp. HCB2-198 TaxID=3383025 RepID=UPI0038B48FAB